MRLGDRLHAHQVLCIKNRQGRTTEWFESTKIRLTMLVVGMHPICYRHIKSIDRVRTTRPTYTVGQNVGGVGRRI